MSRRAQVSLEYESSQGFEADTPDVSSRAVEPDAPDVSRAPMSRQRHKLSLDDMLRLVALANERGIVVASHDDDSGEKLRLNIAAAMVKQPRLPLLDEPTASLDRDSKLRVRTLIERMKEKGCTMLGIFHDFEFMEGLCDREFSEFNMIEGFIDG
jgi:alpha-D-ribose 1-methylphosphonate 5-triphosphate synthase subunit PhnL